MSRRRRAFLMSAYGGTYEGLDIYRWIGMQRSPLHPTGDLRVGVIWRANYNNTTRKDIWLLDGEDRLTLNSPIGDWNTDVQGAKAENILDTTALPLDGDTVTLGTQTYTFQTVLVDVADNVLIGASRATAMINLAAAINDNGTPGTDYGTGTVIHPDVTGKRDGNDMEGIAKVAGNAGNSIVCTEVSTKMSWVRGATFAAGGDDFEHWLDSLSIGNDYVFMFGLRDQTADSYYESINGIMWGRVWDNAAVMEDGLGNAVTELFASGTNRMQVATDNNLPDTHRTADFSVNVLMQHNTSGGTACMYGETTDHLRIYLDRGTGLKCVRFQNQSASWTADVFLDAQLDNSDYRSVTVTVTSHIAQVYLNGVALGSTVDLTGNRNWLAWQGNKYAIGATISSGNKLAGNSLAIRHSETAWTADQVAQLHNADKAFFGLP